MILFSVKFVAQVPDPPFNPMTAPGASGISTLIHTLYWHNPQSVTYNEVYFSEDSALVANNDTSVRVKNGYPSILFSSYNLSEYGTLNPNTKYFWKIIEHNSFGSSISPVWDFTSFTILISEYYCSFDTGLEGWQIIGPQGLSNWYWSNSTHTGSTPGELVFRWDPIFQGDSYVISPEILASPGSQIEIHFNYYEDWWSNIVTVGCAITTNNGTTWDSFWELNADGNVGPAVVDTVIDVPGNFKLGFYYTGNSNDIDFFYADSVYALGVMPLTPPYPPAMLTAETSETQQKVTLTWTPGSAPGGGLVGYQIQRKVGLADSDSSYITIASTDLTQSYEDWNVELNKVYTYRIRSLVMGFNSVYGNEATAYVPDVVPVELLSFSSSVVDDDVTLNWTTATETNNSGFQIEKRETRNERSEDWESIGIVNGNGTTTETKSYSYIDENLSSGIYQYRLKQIDFDGSFEYSNIVEAEILPPAKFSLEQNYPNPFNPTTKISWQSPISSYQTLKVFDILGNEVETLVNEYRTAGKYEAEFNATKLSSGIYYYQLKSGNFVGTKKMILLK
jgi:hypothetical protein